MKILFYHSTEFPKVEGRQAAKLFMPIADCLAGMGHKVGIVAPRDTELPFEWPDRVRHCVFTHLESFIRSLPATQPDLLVLFTDKPEQQRIAEKARGNGIKVLFSELGFLPHYKSLYFDPDGCGPTSSLCRFIPRGELLVGPKCSEIPKVFRKDGPVLVLLQLEEDYNFRASPFPSNSAFVASVKHAFPGNVLVRYHPAMGVEQPPLHEQLRTCVAVVGLNTSALFEALQVGVPCYMLAEGPGRHSGAFLTDFKTTPFHANMECPGWHQRHRRARLLLAELLQQRQIRLDRDVTPEVIFGNSVLGEAIRVEEMSCVRT